MGGSESNDECVSQEGRIAREDAVVPHLEHRQMNESPRRSYLLFNLGVRRLDLVEIACPRA